MTDQVAADAPPPLPTTPEAARETINARIADKAWGAKVLSGDAAAKAELELLHKIEAGIDPYAKASAPSSAEPSPKTIEQVAAEHATQAAEHVANSLLSTLRNRFDVNEHAEQRLRSGEGFSQSDHDATLRYKTQLLADKDFQARVLAGDRHANQQLFLANLVLANGVKEEASA